MVARWDFGETWRWVRLSFTHEGISSSPLGDCAAYPTLAPARSAGERSEWQ